MWIKETSHNTLDHLVRFETFITDAFVRKEHVLTIFICLGKKAYGTTWNHSILSDLWDLSFRGHLPLFRGIFNSLTFQSQSRLNFIRTA